MPRNTTIPARQVQEEIQAYTHHVGSHVTFHIAFGGVNQSSGDFYFFDNQQFEKITVMGNDYTELMSSKPHWSPNKPQGQFRKDDLWEAVDAKRENRGLGKNKNVV